MNDAIRSMLAAYDLDDRNQTLHALREILQEVALLGLWRSKFFESAAFYGGTALRILHGLDRFSEDLDFSLLKPNPSFSLANYGDALQKELESFGFEITFEDKVKQKKSPIESAFLKANTLKQMLLIQAPEAFLQGLSSNQNLKIKIEVDTEPPPGFETDTHFVLKPIPFSVRCYSLPDLFAGKLHAVLCRKWKNRVKGRDWYDLVWYIAHHPQVHLRHLEARMKQSGDLPKEVMLDGALLNQRLLETIDLLNVDLAKHEVSPFVKNQQALEIWSKDFFTALAEKIEPV